MGQLYPEDRVEQIAYVNKTHFRLYYSLEIHEMFRFWLINPNFYRDTYKRLKRAKVIERTKRFLPYYDSMIEHSSDYDRNTLPQEKFDIVILGSDILWDYSIKAFGMDRFVFGNGMNAEKIISYAASFGTVKPEMNHPEFVRKGIQGLKAVSVRDKNSEKIVKNLTGKTPKLVLDPTFLWDFVKEEQVVEPKVEGEYLIVYGSIYPEELKKQAREYADKKGLKIICLDSLNDRFEWCDLIIRQENLTPFEWCGYIKKAHALMTCTYHGLIFGLIYNKKIVFNPTSFILDKASDFMGYLGLEEVLVHKKSFEEKINWEWDYHRINDKIEGMKSESLEFIKKFTKSEE